MRLVVIAVGRLRGPLAPVVADFETRASRYWKLEVVEVDAGVRGGSATAERVMEAEARRILARVPEGLELVALTRDGKGMGSDEFARYLDRLGLHAAPGAAFVIGGAFGLSGAVLGRAQRTLSLSRMTLPHEMARLVLAEQLYRAGTILRGEPYHKG